LGKSFVMFPKGPAGENWYNKDGKSGYWDSSAIYHETGHALWHKLKNGRTLHGADKLEGALFEGFSDAFSCFVQMEDSQITLGDDCGIGHYYDRSAGGVRSGSYRATANVPTGQKFDHIVENRCNADGDEDEPCEKHLVGEVFGSALFRLMANGVPWSTILAGIKQLLQILSTKDQLRATRQINPASVKTLAQTTRDCIMMQIQDDRTYAKASAAFADCGMGSDMDQSHNNYVGRAGSARVTTVAAGDILYNKCQVLFLKPSDVPQTEWNQWQPQHGTKA
jgi:hypothetical protein